jgi:hypothetical protein
MTTERTQSNRDYVIEGAGGKDWTVLWPNVVGTRARLLEALVGVSEAQSVWRPPSGAGEDAWSIVEVTRHVLTYTRNVMAIIDGTARGETVVKDPPGAIHGVGETGLRELYGELVDASASLATLHRELPPVPNLDVRVAHPSMGPFDCCEWYFFLTVHDGTHTRQMTALKLHTDFPR